MGAQARWGLVGGRLAGCLQVSGNDGASAHVAMRVHFHTLGLTTDTASTQSVKVQPPDSSRLGRKAAVRFAVRSARAPYKSGPMPPPPARCSARSAHSSLSGDRLAGSAAARKVHRTLLRKLGTATSMSPA